VALALAFVLAHYTFRGKALLSAVVLMPLVVPPVVTGLVLLDLFGPHGLLGRALAAIGISFAFKWTGAALAAGLVALPLMVRPMRIAFEAIDPALHDAMRTDGASSWRSFIDLDIKLGAPGIIAGIVLGFAKALGEFGATITFVANIPGETRTLSLAIFTALQSADGMRDVYILSAASIVLSLVAVFASEVLTEKLTRKKLK
jgi:molybdate transport system permease protein